MNKPNMSKIIKGVRKSIDKYSPEILTGIGIAGMITTTVMAVRVTPKAHRLIENEKYERSLAEDKDGIIRNFTVIDYVKTAWICYVPAVSIGILSVACIIGASSVNARRNTALATAYTLSESALKGYQGKVIETIGEKKEQSVRDAIAKDKIIQNPVSNQIIITEKGNTLCYDSISGRYFKSDIDCLKKAENELNRQMRDELYISLNEFYYEIGLSPTSIGNDLGWDMDHGYINLRFSSHITDDGTPCLVIDYEIVPMYDYNR